jgi:hypothetical protein
MALTSLLSLVTLTAMLSFTGAIRTISISASSHYDLGFQLGRLAKHEISAQFDSDPQLASLLSVMRTKAGAHAVDSLVAVAAADTPFALEELQGMAAGSNVSLDECTVPKALSSDTQVIAMNFRNEISVLLPTRTLRTDCSDFFYVGASVEATQWAHNEDGDLSNRNTSYFLIANFTHDPSKNFAAYTYPGILPGCAFGFNAHGVVLTTNALFPPTTDANALGRYFLNRRLLSVTSLSEAVDILSSMPSATGFAANFGFIREGRFVNFEVGLGGDFAMTSISKNFSHFNMYERLVAPAVFEPSSARRRERVDTLPPPTTRGQLFAIAGNTDDLDYPIYRNGAPPDDRCVTLATAVFDGEGLAVEVFESNVKTARSASLIVPLDLWRS